MEDACRRCRSAQRRAPSCPCRRRRATAAGRSGDLLHIRYSFSSFLNRVRSGPSHSRLRGPLSGSRAPAAFSGTYDRTSPGGSGRLPGSSRWRYGVLPPGGELPQRLPRARKSSFFLLSRRGVEQVVAAHDLADALGGVVDHHRQVVGGAPSLRRTTKSSTTPSRPARAAGRSNAPRASARTRSAGGRPPARLRRRSPSVRRRQVPG